MPDLVTTLGLKGNPFEHYTAETEPNIAEYTVRPPYLRTIAQRASTPSSFILFGDRGAGKSATRITLFNELWGRKSTEKAGQKPAALALQYVDFGRVIDKFQAGKFVETDFVEETAFLVVEALLAWLSSLTDYERQAYTEAMSKDEKTLMIAFLQRFYLSRSDFEREQTRSMALQLLNQAWTTKSQVWLSRKWGALADLVGAIADAFGKKLVDEKLELAPSVARLVATFGTVGAVNSRIVLQKLVELARLFSFGGIVVLIDKVDETNATQSSAENTTRLVYPLLSHIQLLEIEGFAWILFLWSQVKPYMEGKYPVRLDKIANATIEWDLSFFSEMIKARMGFYSNQTHVFEDMFDNGVLKDDLIPRLVRVAANSPRELVRLIDTIISEHDRIHAHKLETVLISQDVIELGMDRYVRERVTTVYSERSLGQIYRLRTLRFINRDVQAAFRINSQSARNKIRDWEDVGLIKQTGTRAAEGEQGGKPSYEYSIIDARVERIIARELVKLDDLPED